AGKASPAVIQPSLAPAARHVHRPARARGGLPPPGIDCTSMRTHHVVALVAALVSPAVAQSFQMPAHFQAVPLPPVFDTPVDLVFASDGTLFVVEKPGRVRVLDPSGIDQGPLFIDLVAEVNNDWDRGLLGLALAPHWVPDGGGRSWVYLLYTVSPIPPDDNGYNGDSKYSFSRLTRYRAIMQG